MRETLLALLIKEPAHGYELRARLLAAMGSIGDGVSPGQVYVTLSRLEKLGYVSGSRVAQGSAPDKTVYEVTAAGRDVVTEWLLDSEWGKVAPVEFHMKLVAAASTRLADPVMLIDAQRRELLRVLREVQREAATPAVSAGTRVLLEGAALRLQADVRWLEVCERHWAVTREDTDVSGWS
jgi:DNA-binding PadR family transcriptional regulator